MLVLTRKVGEKILIGDQITVTVISITGNRVRLGIEAPSEIGIRRSEVEVEVPPGTQIELSDDSSEPGPGAADAA